MLHRLFNLALRRPDVRHVYRLAVSALADGVLAQVDVDAPRQRKRHHQRRRHQVIGAHFRVDASLKIPVPRKHRRDHEFFLVDRLRNFRGQWSRISDARCTSVPDQMKFQLLEIGRQSSLRQVVGHDFRSGSQRSLHPRRHLQPLLDRFLRQQSCRNQHGGIRSIRARSDGGDDDAAMLQRIFHRGRHMLMNLRIFHANRSRTPAFLLPSRVIRSWNRGSRCSFGRGFRLEQRRQRFLKRLSRQRQHHPILRPLRPRETGFNRGEIKRKQLRIFSLRTLLVMKQSLLAAVGLDQSNLLLAAPGEPQIFQRLFINRKNSASRSIFRTHVGDRGAIGQRQIPQPRPKVLDEFSNDSVLAQHLGYGENKIGGGRTFAQSPRELHARPPTE